MQKSSKFYFSFIYIPFDRAWKVGQKYIIFKSTGPCFTGKKSKDYESVKNGSKQLKNEFLSEIFKFFVIYISVIF